MTYKHFKSIARWAGNKFADEFGGNGKFWADVYFIPYFREKSKNHSRTYYDHGDITLADTRDILKKHRVGNGVFKFESMISWSFETSDFRPSDQDNADILVFRFKAVKGQRQPTLRIVHKLKSKSK